MRKTSSLRGRQTKLPVYEDFVTRPAAARTRKQAVLFSFATRKLIYSGGAKEVRGYRFGCLR